MRIPLHLRQFDILVVNYGLEDSAIAESILMWFTGLMNYLSICYVDINQERDNSFDDKVRIRLGDARAFLALVSAQPERLALYQKHSYYSFEVANQNSDFCSVAFVSDAVLQQTLMPQLRNCTVIHGNVVDFKLLVTIVLALHPSVFLTRKNNLSDVFIWRPWVGEMGDIADSICKPFIQGGFRLVGDHQNLYQEKRDADWRRIRNTLKSCGCLLCIHPYQSRNSELREKGDLIHDTMHRLITIAKEVGIPYMLASTTEVRMDAQLINAAIGYFSIDPSQLDETYTHARSLAESLRDKCVPPGTNAYIFYATHFRDPDTKKLIQKVIEQTSSMPCLLGEEVQKSNTSTSVQQEIFNLVAEAALVIADISESNINSLIEAGAARGAGVECYLLSSGDRHKPPFMLRDKQVFYFKNSLELLNLIYKISHAYRKVILNNEVLGRLSNHSINGGVA